MNRIVTMVLNNLFWVPSAYFQLCHYAKYTDNYPEEMKFEHIRKIIQRAITGGHVNLVVTGQENIPETSGYMFYANHQGMFDPLAIAATCGKPYAENYLEEISCFQRFMAASMTLSMS